MRKLKFKLDRKSLEIINTSFIRPLLEYGDVVWDNCTQYEKEDLQKIQTEAAGTIYLMRPDKLKQLILLRIFSTETDRTSLDTIILAKGNNKSYILA